MQELWKDIKGFEGIYQVSNFGRIKSLRRIVAGRWGNQQISEKIMSLVNGTKNYKLVNLALNRKKKVCKVHQLVWDAFGDRPRDGLRLQVDHIDHNKANNRIDNLQLLSNRNNVIKMFSTKKRSSQYPGVSWHKQNNYWTARIKVGKVYKHLGVFQDELEAAKAYQDIKSQIEKDETQ